MTTTKTGRRRARQRRAARPRVTPDRGTTRLTRAVAPASHPDQIFNRPTTHPPAPTQLAEDEPASDPTGHTSIGEPAPSGLRALIPRLPDPVRRRLTARRLLLLELAVIATLAVTGLVQAFLLASPDTRSDAIAQSGARTGYIDPYRSVGDGRLWLTTAALVDVAHLPGGGSGQRVLLDAPVDLTIGARVTVHIAADGHQVRSGPLPGPAVLPRGQGALLLLALFALIPTVRAHRRARRRTHAEDPRGGGAADRPAARGPGRHR